MMEQLDTLPIQYRLIELMHEGVCLNFLLTIVMEQFDNLPIRTWTH